MLRKTMGAVAIAAVMMLSAGLAAAQAPAAKPAADPATVRADIDKAVEAMRKDARAGKAEILGKTMALDSAQAATFWPLYRQYEAEAKQLGDERLGIIQDLGEHFDSLDDVKAKGCGINRASMFPDLDGLSAYLTWSFSRDKDE